METKNYEVIIIGGGASGTALLYTLARYTNISRIALLEKYSEIGSVNSNARNNSQTLHVGDIETNYSLEKARLVRPASMMVARYIESLPSKERYAISARVQKMVLAVGETEVAKLDKRYEEIKDLFPNLKKIDAEEIRNIEPEVMRGRNKDMPVLALFDPAGYSVNFGLLAQSFVEKAKNTDVFLNRPVSSIEKKSDGYIVRTKNGDLHASVVIVDTDAYSLRFAKSLGYGKEFSLIPIAGSFYFSRELLRGKVYTMQDPRMPFAAPHGDPDMTRPHATRFGPTARFFPVLEARNNKTMKHFFASSGLHKGKTWASFGSILLNPTRFKYLVKNIFYELPYVGTYFYVPELRKIIPTLHGRDLKRAEGFGGMRLQRVDTNTRELLLGEGKIIGDNIIFNMTPSPGASVCLYNAMRDTEKIIEFLSGKYFFEKEKITHDLMGDNLQKNSDVSAETYVS